LKYRNPWLKIDPHFKKPRRGECGVFSGNYGKLEYSIERERERTIQPAIAMASWPLEIILWG
jgi:hypothetical protein